MSQGGATILWVHQHWNRLIDQEMLLENNYYKVLEATDGPEKLRLFLSQPVDVVILDYQLSGMNGDVVAAEMKLLKPHVPITLLSADGPLTKRKLKSVVSAIKFPAAEVLLSTLRGVPDGWSRPFFCRWLDQ
jgi:response regulator RpfG family c-di-GMP phosphodiesterase